MAFVEGGKRRSGTTVAPALELRAGRRPQRAGFRPDIHPLAKAGQARAACMVG